MDVWYKRTEGMLNNLLDMQTEIRDIELRLADLENDENYGVAPISYSERTGETYKISSTVENNALNNIEKRDWLIYRQKHLELRVKRMLEVISTLEELQRDIVVAKYLSRKKWYEVAYLVKCSERQCRRHHRRAVTRISHVIFSLNE